MVPMFCHDQTLLSRIASRIIGLTGLPGHRRFTTSSLCSALVDAGVTIDEVETAPEVFPISVVSGRFG